MGLINLPTGVIIMWSGAIANIPPNYVICDGNNGTPDLRNKFVVGAGDTYAVDQTGGNDAHNHSFTADFHDHNILAGSGIAAGVDGQSTVEPEAALGDTDNTSNLPPFYSLAYIMRT